MLLLYCKMTHHIPFESLLTTSPYISLKIFFSTVPFFCPKQLSQATICTLWQSSWWPQRWLPPSRCILHSKCKTLQNHSPVCVHTTLNMQAVTTSLVFSALAHACCTPVQDCDSEISSGNAVSEVRLCTPLGTPWWSEQRFISNVVINWQHHGDISTLALIYYIFIEADITQLSLVVISFHYCLHSFPVGHSTGRKISLWEHHILSLHDSNEALCEQIYWKCQYFGSYKWWTGCHIQPVILQEL